LKPRTLVITDRAARDLRKRRRVLREARGPPFADAAVDGLVAKLESIADGGAQIGTALADDPRVRSFGYANHATVIARFTPGELRILRVLFKGQD
jgi:plasmid stabilization system protein ParE